MRCSPAASGPMPPTRGRCGCGSCPTTCARVRPPTPSRSPSCSPPIGRPRRLPDELYELMRCAPSTRRFTDEPVSREVLERVLDNARFAPSGGNRQGWRVIVVTDPALRRQLRDLYQEPWDAYMAKTGG